MKLFSEAQFASILFFGHKISWIKGEGFSIFWEITFSKDFHYPREHNTVNISPLYRIHVQINLCQDVQSTINSTGSQERTHTFVISVMIEQVLFNTTYTDTVQIGMKIQKQGKGSNYLKKSGFRA